MPFHCKGRKPTRRDAFSLAKLGGGGFRYENIFAPDFLSASSVFETITMKIVLISPYESVASYGVRMLSAVLKQRGHEVRIIFLPLHFEERYSAELLERIAEVVKDTPLVGISLSSNYFDRAVELTRALKAKKPEQRILWGGIHPTIEPEECLDYADIVCIGEAERALGELVEKIERGEDYGGVKGFGFRRNGEKHVNPIAPLVTDLDVLPFPDYSYADHVILHDGKLVQATPELIAANLEGRYWTLSSRGCLFQCTFCCNNLLRHLYGGDTWFRKRSTENIIAELEWIKKDHPLFKEIYFDDDAFLDRSLDEIRDFADTYKRRVAMPFVITGVTPNSLTEEKLTILLDAGMIWFRIGIQTASDRVNLKIYKRPTLLQSTRRAIEIIRKYKDRMKPVWYDFIVDNPWEKPEELLETLRLMLELPRPYAINIYSLTFFPGTELHERAVHEGFVRDAQSDIYRKSYKRYRETYLNRLLMFYCLSQLPKWFLRLFVNPVILATGLNYPLWYGYALLRSARKNYYDLISKLRRPSVK
jgi:anaerobic magnesium-protoporphyrin IX monomethyl ester cyclase